MAKGEAERVNDLARNETRYDQAYRNDELEYQRDRRNIETQRADELYNSIYGGYNDMATTGGLSDDDRNRLRGFISNKRDIINGGGSGGGGGFMSYDYRGPDLSPLNELERLYRDSISGKSIDTNALRRGVPYVQALAENGGYTPEFLSSIGQDIGLLKGIAATGGVDAEGINRMRGAGVFDEFANTGGLSDSDRSMLRARGNSVIPSMYGQMRDTATRNARVGNSAVGLSALQSRLGRQAARDAQSSALDTELGITDRTLQGRQWGATSLANAEAGLQDLMSSNRMNALNSSIVNQRGIQEFMSSMGLDAGRWLSEMEVPIQGMLTDERRYGIGGLNEVIQQRLAEQRAAEAARAAGVADYNANVGRNRDLLLGLEDEGLDLERYLLEYGNNNRFGGLEGLTNLRLNPSGDVALREGIIGSNRGQESANTRTNIEQQMNYNPNRGFLDYLAGIGQVAGGVGGLVTGIGGFGNTRNRPNPGGAQGSWRGVPYS